MTKNIKLDYNSDAMAQIDFLKTALKTNSKWNNCDLTAKAVVEIAANMLWDDFMKDRRDGTHQREMYSKEG